MNPKWLIEKAIFVATFIPGLAKYAIIAQAAEPVVEGIADDVTARLNSPEGQAAIAAGKAAIKAAVAPADVPAGIPPADVDQAPHESGVIESPVPYGG